ncbi:domain found in IF2B/IF5-domain-containing protein [Daldinia loculata]|uniref:domain found in IF2B/IF5-domain-containing protein n=1 Tax=Daldinia loculata TaxID=103429 RepID=UPI0020C42B71|nr:domain found in IF2B/IF5-domain-containing protein [Daldinia loculata]KAI1647558.1 domain found in IF2B/IF5-domain-containing protein [Daldinia loculata]KAI2784992.1 domain found in IF2B/IF5-domain-containing protein [Daldinia loculata]
MALVNVRRDVTDAFYRYKMERIQTKIEGKGNGIKTVVVNLSSVAQSLARPGSYVIKYFGFELGAQTNIDPPDDRWIINGAHEASKLQDHLDGFINKFVLCKKCKNPETDVVIKDGHIVLDCKACGQRTDVDLRLKLSGFILKNQPRKGGKKDKAERKAARKAKQQALQNGNKENGQGSGGENSENGSNGSGDKIEDEDDAGSDDEFTRKINADAQVIDAPAVVRDDDWAVDMSEKAVKARQSQLPSEFRQKLVLGGAEDDDDEGESGGHTVYDTLGDWIQEEATKAGSINKVDDIQIYVKAKELGIETKHKTVLVLVQTLFDENILTQIPKRAAMLKQIITSERHEKALLGGLERLLAAQGKEHPELLTSDKIVKILHQLYDKDLLGSEDMIKKWGSKASKKYVDLSTSKKIRRAAEPFMKWLDEAEEDSDEE